MPYTAQKGIAPKDILENEPKKGDTTHEAQVKKDRLTAVYVFYQYITTGIPGEIVL